jgi:light-regulated signal transduction histidine kinase (bacteriophytochrome)
MQIAHNTHKLDDEVAQIAQEYEDFAYIVSHDLNAPLRHVKEFTRLLIGGRKDQLTVEEQEYVNFLQKSLEKLDDMQKALLTFSRLNTWAGDLRESDCNEVVANVLRELDHDVRTYSPAIECGDLPTIMAEPKQLHLLFVHLIDNALKFHDEDTLKRKILITALDQEDQWLFEVRDNGIGIDEDYHEEVLRLFRRLDPERYKGIGAGLTIAHKIVQRHGGELLIESECGEGCSVFFSMPKM